MPLISYKNINFSVVSRARIDQANEILSEYADQGFDLTLRQLYYQFVSRGLMDNKQSNYKRLGEIVSDGRLAGLIDWGMLVDRTRELKSLAHWDSPRDIVMACASQFRLDKWADQDYHVEVWVEKDALSGVLQVACGPLDVAYFSCRGYTSQSSMWAAAQRIGRKVDSGRMARVILLTDHDPSGIDMGRDVRDRLSLLSRGVDIEMDRIALTMDQVRTMDPPPPPNPAKITDSRAASYIDQFGDESWELDALPPDELVRLITEAVVRYRDDKPWEEAVEKEERNRDELRAVGNNWDSVVDLVGGEETL